MAVYNLCERMHFKYHKSDIKQLRSIYVIMFIIYHILTDIIK